MHALGPFLADGSGLPPVAVAVSGGGDSLCLAWLARHWRPTLLALVVDHGLRADSAQEARWTIERLRHMGLTTRLLTLTDLPYGPGIAARARQARYAALAQACQDAGCVDLLLGHQADDQAETTCMRERAGSGPDGLAAMGWISLRPGLRLIRPLLDVSRQALRNTLAAAGEPWVDDPSNDDRRAERVRVRQTLHQQPHLRDQYWHMAMQAGTGRMRQMTAMAGVLARQISLSPLGWARLGATLPEPAVLASLLRAIGGMAYPPAPAAVARLHAAGQAATLGGARLTQWQGQWYLVREQAAIAPPQPARVGLVWDNRFQLVAMPPLASTCPDVSIGACGSGLPRAARQGWPALFCATLPAVWQGGRRVAVPHLGLAEAGWAGADIAFHPPGMVTGGSLHGGSGGWAEQYVCPAY